MVHVRYWDFDLNMAVTVFFSLELLCWAASLDKKSADAGAVFSTCMGAFERESITPTMLKEGLISGSFDGATVMLGADNSVATRFLQLAAQMIITHAVAHRLELVWADACVEVCYLLLVAEVLADAYSLLSVSLKKNHAMKEMADLLDQPPVSHKSGHGIRWLASQKRVIQAFLRTWHVFVCFLEATALASVGCSLTTTSHRDDFLLKRLMFDFEGKGRTQAARVVSCISPLGTIITEEIFKASTQAPTVALLFISSHEFL